MRVTSSGRLAMPECSDVVIKLVLEPMPGEKLQPFISGQVVRLGLPGLKRPSPGYFAIASEPENDCHYEFVIKLADGISKTISDMEPGARVEVDGPMGKGFDIGSYQGSDVYLLGVGTGIAPLRSVWRSIIRQRENYGKVAIFAGFLTPLHQLLTDEMDALSEYAIEVNVSVTTGDESWDGPIGFVQDALSEHAPSGENTIACVAGMSTMVDACTETLQNLGFNDDHILLNH